jgi:hypothetical protein
MRIDPEYRFIDPGPGPLCPHCKKRHLWSTDERELHICNYCADRQYERHQERREWEYYHPR